jgi:hypothetical protein
MTKASHSIGGDRLALSLLLVALRREPCTLKMLMEETGSCRWTINNWLVAWMSPRIRLVHISHWISETKDMGKYKYIVYFPAYKLGDAPDAPKPSRTKSYDATH